METDNSAAGYAWCSSRALPTLASVLLFQICIGRTRTAAAEAARTPERATGCAWVSEHDPGMAGAFENVAAGGSLVLPYAGRQRRVM
jgi:hypothetical protein